MPANNLDANPAPTAEPKPVQYNCMKSLLTSMGIDAYEPPVVDMLIDFVYSYSKDVLLDARAYGEAAGKAAGSIGSQDIELAIRSRSFAQPVSLQALNAWPDELNKHELLEIGGGTGLLLPSTGPLLVPNTLKAMADELSKHELPAIEGRTGLPLLSTRTFVGHLLVALKAMADELNKHELPAIEGRTGLPLPSTGSLLVPNVQYSQDINDSDGDEDMADSGDDGPVDAPQAVPTVAAVPASGIPPADLGGA